MKYFSINSKNLTFILIIILLLSFSKIFLGLDVTDEGWLLSGYKLIFSPEYELNPHDFKFIGTFIIGGFFYNFLGLENLYFYRILYYFISILTLFIIFKTLQEKLRLKNIELFNILFLVFLFNTGNDYLIISYDNLSLLIISCYIFYFSKKKKEYKDYILLGTLNFILIFLSFRNIPLCLLSIIFFFKLFDNFNSIKSRFIYFILGNILSILAISLLLFFLGHLSSYFFQYIEIVYEIFDINQNSHYRASYILIRLARDILICFAFLIIIYLSNLILKNNNFLKKNLIFFFLSIGLYVIDKYIIDFSRWYIVCIFTYIICFQLYIDKNQKFFYLTLILSSFLFISGSAAGIDKISFFYYFLLPITFNYLKYSKINSNDKIFSLNERKIYINLFTFFFLTFATLSNFSNTYRDSSNKLNLNTRINNKKLVNIFTTKIRATKLNELIKFIDEKKINNETTLVIGSIPIIFYLYDVKPYLYTWPELLTKKEIDKKLKDTDNLPKYIIKSKVDTMRKNWPLDADINFQVTQSFDKRLFQLNKFLEIGNYKKVWSNDSFSFYELINEN